MVARYRIWIGFVCSCVKQKANVRPCDRGIRSSTANWLAEVFMMDASVPLLPSALYRLVQVLLHAGTNAQAGTKECARSVRLRMMRIAVMRTWLT